MKYLVFAFALAAAAPFATKAATLSSTDAPTATTAVDQQTPPADSKAARKARKAARDRKAPEVYKGTVAQQQRIITDAPDAQKDKDPEEKGGKAAKMSKKDTQ